MGKNRKAAETIIIKYIDKILPKSENTRMYQELFAAMSDKQFDEFMARLEDGTDRLAIIAPNLTEPKLSVERNLDLAIELGHNFFERIWIEGDEGVPRYLSPIPYLVADLPLRRQQQLLVKKISIPEHNKSIDDFTGQPTGVSKGSKISYPELQIMAALNLDNCIEEMIKYRGGDIKGFDAMNTVISKTGGVSLKSIAALGTKVESTKTLHTFLVCMHLENSL